MGEQRGILELRIKELQHENEIQRKKITVEVDEHVEVVIEKGREIESLKAELESLQERYKIELEQSRMEFQKTHIGAKDDEIKAIVDKLEAQIKQYQQLQEVKIALDMEIAVFRRLIENEEDRLDLSCDISPSKTIRRRRSSS